MAEYHRDPKAKHGRCATCKTCAKERARKWWRSHPERTKELHENRCKSGRKRASDARYYRSHVDKWRARRVEYVRTGKMAHLKHAHYERHKAAIMRKAAAWQKSHPDSVKATKKAWAQAHPESRRTIEHRRRARLNNVPSTMSPTAWEAILRQHGYACKYCGRTDRKLERDHVIPIARGGHDIPANVVPACRSCNAHKGAKVLA